MSSYLWLRGTLRQLHQGQESATFVRLGRSRHVADLRLIFWATIIIILVSAVLAVCFDFWHTIMANWAAVKGRTNNWLLVQYWVEAIGSSGAFIGAIGAAGCGVLAWTYQSGSARLGTVDLFACEIATLCRVAIVVDMVQRYVDQFHSGAATQPVPLEQDALPVGGSFTSQESYFPVFDASMKDLQSLEADVVRHVTAFYTYMKVMRDMLRKLTGMPHPQPGDGDDDEWHRVISNVVYMQFLALESARHAMRDLVEYEPTQAEGIITILLSELVAYDFLRKRFKDALRQGRLKAREAGYRREVHGLHRDVTAGKGTGWGQAKGLLNELMERYRQLFPDDALAPTHHPVRG
jgi:hypothetical protein